MHDSITVTDLFCGAGGSSSGLKKLDGVSVRQAANHWRAAVDTHNANHPEADHDCADISQVDPRRYPRTTLLWASPECTNHTGAKGQKRTDQLSLLDQNTPDEAAERSRATMWDVARFAEYHRYAGFIVENVVEATKWIGWRGWKITLEDMGYCLHSVYLNSAFASQLGAPAPQSRDRLYVLGHLKTSRCPDLDRWTRPHAWCPTCDRAVQAIQAWKKTTPGGKYRSQYVQPLVMDPRSSRRLQNCLVVVDTQVGRSAGAVLRKQARRLRRESTRRSVEAMARLALEMRDELERGRVDTFGEALHKAWTLKMDLLGGAGDLVSGLYNRGLAAGASGGKLLGAGAGGHMLFHVPEERRAQFDDQMADLVCFPLRVAACGTEVHRAA
ncbi:DNA cytosine methyltransferase [Yimella sp. cx-573]|nr:DNA cytosine methyltransferase [Yimella sp. cx-573]